MSYNEKRIRSPRRKYILYDDTAHTEYSVVKHDDVLKCRWDRKRDGKRWKFRSLFSYDMDNVADYMNTQEDRGEILPSGQPSLGGFDSNDPYDARCCVIDIDSDSRLIALQQARIVHEWMSEQDPWIPHIIWLSGSKGYHIEIMHEHVGWGLEKDFAEHMKHFVWELKNRIEDEMNLSTSLDFDPTIYERNRKYRLPNCWRQSTGKYKITCPTKLLMKSPSKQYSMASEAGPLPPYGEIDWNPHPMLKDIWNNTKNQTGHVEVKRSFYGSSDTKIENIDDITNKLEKQHGTKWGTWKGKDILQNINCPIHSDSNASAGWIPEWASYVCFGCRDKGIDHSVNALADAIGVNLIRKKNLQINSLSDAEDELEKEMRRIANSDKNALISVPTGVGKSHTAKVIAKESDGTFLITGDTHEGLREDQEKAENEHGMDTVHRDKPWIEEPRCEDVPVPDVPDVLADSRREYMEVLQSNDKGREIACETCPANPNNDVNDPDIDWECKFQQKSEEMKNEEKHGLSVKNYLAYQSKLEKWADERECVIVDEDCFSKFLSVETFDMDTLEKQVREYDDISVYSDDLPDHIRNLRHLTEFIIEEGEFPVSHENTDLYFEDWENDFPMKGVDVLKEENGNKYIGFSSQFTPDPDSILNKWKNTLMSNIQEIRKERGELIISTYSQPPQDLQYIFLDASADENDYRFLSHFFQGREMEFIDIDCVNPDTNVYHDPSSSWSGKTKERLIERYRKDDPEKCDRIQRLIDYINEKDGSKCLITHKPSDEAKKDFVQIIFDNTDITRDDLMWYGQMRGFDKFNGRDHTFIIGDPGVPKAAYRDESLRFGLGWDDDFMVFDNDEYSNFECEAYKLGYPILRPNYDDNENVRKLGEFLHDRVVRRDIYQAIGRSRGIRHDVDIHVFCAPDFDCPEFNYHVDPYLLSDSSPKVESQSKEMLEACWILETTFWKLKTIADETDINYQKIQRIKEERCPDRMEKRNEKIVELYEEYDLTYQELADYLGKDVSKQTVGRVCRENL
jgi:hypothetical protein